MAAEVIGQQAQQRFGGGERALAGIGLRGTELVRLAPRAGALLVDLDCPPEEVDRAHPQSGYFSPPQPEQGTDPDHGGVRGRHSVRQGHELLGREHVDLGLGRLREVDAPARRAADVVAAGGEVGHGPQHAVGPPDGAGRAGGGDVVDDALDVGWGDGPHLPPPERPATRVRRALWSRSRALARLAGLDASHSSATSAKVRAAWRRSTHTPPSRDASSARWKRSASLRVVNVRV